MAIIIKKKPNLEKLPVSKLYTTLTGKPWSTAKKEGLTNGSYKQNMALRTKLLAQVVSDNKSESNDTPKETKKSSKDKINDFSKAGSFGAAFNAANELLGENAVFRYKGKMFTTDLKKASVKKTDVEEEWDEEELPLDDVVINRVSKTDRSADELANTETQRLMLESLSPYMEDTEEVNNRRTQNKINWMLRDYSQQYNKGGILPYKYKNGGKDEDKKNKKKKKTYSETPKTMEATEYGSGKKKIAPRPKASKTGIAQMKAMEEKAKKKKRDMASKAKNK